MRRATCSAWICRGHSPEVKQHGRGAGVISMRACGPSSSRRVAARTRSCTHLVGDAGDGAEGVPLRPGCIPASQRAPRGTSPRSPGSRLRVGVRLVLDAPDQPRLAPDRAVSFCRFLGRGRAAGAVHSIEQLGHRGQRDGRRAILRRSPAGAGNWQNNEPGRPPRVTHTQNPHADARTQVTSERAQRGAVYVGQMKASRDETIITVHTRSARPRLTDDPSSVKAFTGSRATSSRGSGTRGDGKLRSFEAKRCS